MFKSRTVNSIIVNDIECEVQHEHVHGSELTAQVGDKIVVAYLVYDNDCCLDDLMGDCVGKLYSFHRHSRDISEGLEALGNNSEGEADLDAVWGNHEATAVSRYLAKVRKDYSFAEVREKLDDPEMRGWAQVLEALTHDVNGVSDWDQVEYEDAMQAVLEEMWAEPAYFPGDRDAQVLACYEHGGQSWSLSGEGMQCRWDTSNKAGVFVPDTCLKEQLDSDEKAGEDRVAQARIYCKQFLESYNNIVNGAVYGCVVKTFDLDGTQTDEDACWGFVGSDYAEATLKSEYFEATCESLRATA